MVWLQVYYKAFKLVVYIQNPYMKAHLFTQDSTHEDSSAQETPGNSTGINKNIESIKNIEPIKKKQIKFNRIKLFSINSSRTTTPEYIFN